MDVSVTVVAVNDQNNISTEAYKSFHTKKIGQFFLLQRLSYKIDIGLHYIKCNVIKCMWNFHTEKRGMMHVVTTATNIYWYFCPMTGSSAQR